MPSFSRALPTPLRKSMPAWPPAVFTTSSAACFTSRAKPGMSSETSLLSAPAPLAARSLAPPQTSETAPFTLSKMLLMPCQRSPGLGRLSPPPLRWEKRSGTVAVWACCGAWAWPVSAAWFVCAGAAVGCCGWTAGDAAESAGRTDMGSLRCWIIPCFGPRLRGDQGMGIYKDWPLERLVRPPVVVEYDRLRAFWEAHLGRSVGLAPLDAAVVGGVNADRLGWAFLAGYQAALRVLDPELPAEALAAFCATEARGVHPRDIE